MASLRLLTDKLEVGDHLAWVGEKAVDDVERVYTKRVTNVVDRGNTTRVEAEGIRGGEYYYTVDSVGNSEAFFVNPNEDDPTSMGKIVYAELTDSSSLRDAREGVFDDLDRSR